MAPKSKGTKINAFPTKEFFIEMLVRDVDLIPAIIDLIDNCSDGVIREKGDKDYSGYRVHIDADDHEFKISDNCGGIGIALARDCAFRFGKTPSAEILKHSVGRAGIGMKRALFKMGNHFIVDSTTRNSHFKIDVKVDEWRKDEDNWNFDWKEIDEEKHDEKEVGTRIEISELYEGVSQDLALPPVISQIKDEIKIRHREIIEKGLEIKLNQFILSSVPAVLHESTKIRSAHRYNQWQTKTGKKVKVNIYTGIGKSVPADAGWYVYCNGRLVLESDQSAVTGWSELSEPAMPKYHNQFSRFRGYLFFDGDDPATLPWNTSKTGIDEGNEIYRKAKLEMTEMMRPVIDFLNAVDAEKDIPEGKRPLEELLKKTEPKEISTISILRDFKCPKSVSASREANTKIRYERSSRKVERAKKILGVRSAKEVGEKTFDIFYKESGEE